MKAALPLLFGVALSACLPSVVTAAVLKQPGSPYSEFRLTNEPRALGTDQRLAGVPLPAGIALFGAAVASMALWGVGAARPAPGEPAHGSSRRK